jgi:hypothetical protein
MTVISRIKDRQFHFDGEHQDSTSESSKRRVWGAFTGKIIFVLNVDGKKRHIAGKNRHIEPRTLCQKLETDLLVYEKFR